jgi:hypothetical protein
MSKRLQVLLPDPEFRRLRQVAKRSRMTVAEWVRQALRAAWRKEPSRGKQEKLQAIREAAAHQGPTADIEQMLREIEQGYLGKQPE